MIIGNNASNFGRPATFYVGGLSGTFKTQQAIEILRKENANKSESALLLLPYATDLNRIQSFYTVYDAYADLNIDDKVHFPSYVSDALKRNEINYVAAFAKSLVAPNEHLRFISLDMRRRAFAGFLSRLPKSSVEREALTSYPFKETGGLRIIAQVELFPPFDYQAMLHRAKALEIKRKFPGLIHEIARFLEQFDAEIKASEMVDPTRYLADAIRLIRSGNASPPSSVIVDNADALSVADLEMVLALAEHPSCRALYLFSDYAREGAYATATLQLLDQLHEWSRATGRQQPHATLIEGGRFNLLFCRTFYHIAFPQAKEDRWQKVVDSSQLLVAGARRPIVQFKSLYPKDLKEEAKWIFTSLEGLSQSRTSSAPFVVSHVNPTSLFRYKLTLQQLSIRLLDQNVRDPFFGVILRLARIAAAEHFGIRANDIHDLIRAMGNDFVEAYDKAREAVYKEAPYNTHRMQTTAADAQEVIVTLRALDRMNDPRAKALFNAINSVELPNRKLAGEVIQPMAHLPQIKAVLDALPFIESPIFHRKVDEIVYVVKDMDYAFPINSLVSWDEPVTFLKGRDEADQIWPSVSSADWVYLATPSRLRTVRSDSVLMPGLIEEIWGAPLSLRYEATRLYNIYASAEDMVIHFSPLTFCGEPSHVPKVLLQLSNVVGFSPTRSGATRSMR